MVSVEHQRMAFFEGGAQRAVFDVSTSRNAPSCKADSFGTPLGLHAIADKIGGDCPSGSVFRGRVPVATHFAELEPNAREQNLITSRILRLKGLVPGINNGPACDSYTRYIYIHGTNHEDRIGRPFSGGCIEMRNADVIWLFERVAPGDFVWIDAP